MKRRHFLEAIALSTASLGMGQVWSAPKLKSNLDVLVLGGTNFLGPAVVNALVRNGHSVTLFNRGLTNPDMFPNLPLIRGDREKGKQAYIPLKKDKWDVVVDVWPQHSKLVDEATSVLQSNTEHYIFVSSVAVYQNFDEPGRSEGEPVLRLPDDKTTWGYSEEKTAAENLVKTRFPENHTILRPGPIKGWRDPAYDLLYWLLKLQKGGDILAPGIGEDPLQFIDVKDVANFAVLSAENKTMGIYNCVGPEPETLRWRSFLNRAKSHLQSESKLFWSDKKFLEGQKVYAWDSLPLWAPVSDDYFMQVSNEKAMANGFVYTPIEQTIDDCLLWHETYGKADVVFGEGEHPVGITKQKEMQVISLLKQRQTRD